MENYTALIMDIENSRLYPVKERNIIQYRIYEIVKELNVILSSVIVMNVEFSGGDELEGLFLSEEAALSYLEIFESLIAPVRIRWGIGTGEWNVRVKGAGTNAQDGPAYHNARDDMEKRRLSNLQN